ncbi:MAG: hypothetical protein U0787_09740 [Polyangia bacterium]
MRRHLLGFALAIGLSSGMVPTGLGSGVAHAQDLASFEKRTQAGAARQRFDGDCRRAS